MFKTPLTIPDQVKIDNLMTQIKDLYFQLKDCDHAPIQATIIWSLKPKCQQVLDLLSKCEQMSGYLIKKKKVLEIRKKIEEVETKIQNNEINNPQIGSGGRIEKLNDKNYTQKDLQAELSEQIDIGQAIAQLDLPKQQQATKGKDKDKDLYRSSISVLRSIAIQQIEATQLKYTQQQLDQVLKRLENNQELVKQVQSMIISQGHDLDKVDQNIQKAYENVEAMNTHLDQAEKQQIKAINKVRAAIQKSAMGFWGIVSWPFRKMFRRRKPKQTTPTPTPQ